MFKEVVFQILFLEILNNNVVLNLFSISGVLTVSLSESDQIYGTSPRENAHYDTHKILYTIYLTALEMAFLQGI